MNFGLSISTTFIIYLRKHEILTATSATDATTRVHLAGRSVAINSPRPKQTADFILCLWHFISSPFIIIYAKSVCVLEISVILYYDRVGDKMKTIEIQKNDANQRLDKFMQKRFKTMPKAMVYMYIRKKCVKRNGKKCVPEEMLREGDVLTLYIKDEFFEAAQEKHYEFLKAPAKLDIVYEDENLLLLDKKPGVIVHQDKSYHFDSLVARVQHYLYDKGEYDPEKENAFSPALVNRIDRNTGGIVIAAKNAEALRILNQKMKTRELSKFYLCLLHGMPKRREALLTAYMIKDESKNRVKVFAHPVEGGKEMKTKVQIIGQRGKYAIAEVELLTGRTHQIRAHLSFAGHPLAGDSKYGAKGDDMRYQALYSYKLRFDFTADAGILNYLNGKEFTVDTKNIWFLK